MSRRALIFLLLAPGIVTAQDGPLNANQPVPPERTAARAWFQSAKFGMFIHWGVYSLLGQGEWVMQNRQIPVDNYEWLASTFNPVKFNAREWVTLAKSAGVRYITITARHHDGFSMFATRATSYNIVDGTPFRRDPLKELADECRAQGIKLFFYYSQLDWHHVDYWPRSGEKRVYSVGSYCRSHYPETAARFRSRFALRWMRQSRSRYATAPLRHASVLVRSRNFQHCGKTLSIPL